MTKKPIVLFVLGIIITQSYLESFVEQNMPKDLRGALGCESSYEATPEGIPQQFNKDGSLRTHKNKNGSIDYGAAMINSSNHAWATKLGLSYQTSKLDNYIMALHIYASQGIKAWYAYDPKTKQCVWQNQYQKKQ